MDAPVDVHRRSHNFLLIHPRGVWLDWHWVFARPLSTCGVILLSLPLGVGWTGVGLVYWSHAWQTPTHKETPVSDAMRRSQFQWRMHDYLHWSITLKEGTSVMIWLATLHASSSHLSLIFLFPLKASAYTKTRSPGFRFAAPIFWSWYSFCHWASAIDWAWTSQRAALSWSWTVATYSSTCLAEVPLMGTSVLLNVGK